MEYQRQRSFIIIAIIALFVIIFVAFFARHGVVIISADNGLSMSIHEDDGSKIVDNTKSYFAFAPTGTYIASGSSDSKSTAKYYTVHPFSFQHITLHADQKMIDTSPVTNYSHILNVQPTKNSVRFYDDSSQTIRAITTNNRIATINSQKFASVTWASDGKSAIGVTSSTPTKLYVIRGNALSELPLPTKINNPDSVSAAIASSGRVYVAIDKQLFTAATTGSTYQRVGRLGDNTTVTAAAGDTALLSQYVSSGADDFSYKIMIATPDSIGASTTIKGIPSPESGHTASLSPNGKEVFITNNDAGTVYDSSFNKLYNVPSIQSTAGGWVDNHTVIYTSEEKVWEYNQDTESADAIAQMPTVEAYTGLKFSEPNLHVSNIYTDQKDGVVYLGAQMNGDSVLYRVNTSKSQINKTITSIGLTTVTTFPNFCTAYYIGVTKPTFYIYGAVIPQDCIDAVRSFTSALGIPSSAVSIINT